MKPIGGLKMGVTTWIFEPEEREIIGKDIIKLEDNEVELMRNTNNKIQLINQELLKMRDTGISRKDISDGYHTFGELYFHRMVLFSIILNQNPDISWKAKKHHDGTMFDDDSFICGIDTPDGQYTYHYNLEYWDYFIVKELEYAPEYDGHKPKDITRLFSILKNNHRKKDKTK